MDVIIDRINESLSIHRSILICKDEVEVATKLQVLKEKDYPCTDSCDEGDGLIEHFRVLILTYERFLDNIDLIPMNEMTIIYTTCIAHLENLTKVMDFWKIKMLVTLVE